MKISRIHLENFRGIENITLESLSDLTIITGTNGSGKTSVLNAISILLSWLVARLNSPKGQGQKIPDKDITIGKPHCYLEIELNNGVRWSLYKEKGSAGTKLSDKRTDLSQLNIFANQILECLKGEDTNVPLIAAYGVNRRVDATPIDIRRGTKFHRWDALSWDIATAVDFHDFFLWYRLSEDVENERMREMGYYVPQKSLQAVRRALSQLGNTHSNLKVNRREKTFNISKNGTLLELNQLSEGEKTYILLVLDIARRLVMTHHSLEDPLKGKGVVMIDEVELHVHPSLQRVVIDNLRGIFPKCQFIVTTNSPLVVSDVNSSVGDKLIRISNGTTCEITSNVYGKGFDKILNEVF